MFEILFNFIDVIVVNNISSLMVVFTDTIKPLLGACVILYILYLSYQSLYDAENLVVKEAIKTIASLAVITSIAFSTTLYLNHVVPAVLNTGDSVANALLGGLGGASSLQNMFDMIMTTIQDMWGQIDLKFLNGESWLATINIFIQIIITALGAIPFFAISVSYLLVAKIMVSFLLIIGPLFIMFAFFPSTRSFFQSWTGQCFNYALLTIIYPLAFTVFQQALDVTVFSMNLTIQTSFLTMIVFFALIVLSLQIPTFCSTLSGGIGINGLVGGISSVINSMKPGVSAMGKGAKLAGKGAAKVAGAVNDKVKGAIKPG